MNNCEDLLGRYATSKAGRDKGKKLIIVGIADENHVLVCDGRLRKVENPKKKKLMHLNISNDYATEIREKLMAEEKITNSEIRKLFPIEIF